MDWTIDYRLDCRLDYRLDCRSDYRLYYRLDYRLDYTIDYTVGNIISGISVFDNKRNIFASSLFPYFSQVNCFIYSVIISLKS